jgi:hypothetical protein
LREAGRFGVMSRAALVWPTPEMSSFSPSTARMAQRRIAAGSTGTPRDSISPFGREWFTNTVCTVCR